MTTDNSPGSVPVSPAPLCLTLSPDDAAAVLASLSMRANYLRQVAACPLSQSTANAAEALVLRVSAAHSMALAQVALFASIAADSPTRARQKCERRNVAAVVDALLAAGYLLNVDNGGDDYELPAFTADRAEVLGAMFATDDEKLHARKGSICGWVWLVYGNADDGSEVVSDYTVNLEHVIGPVCDEFAQL